ncbi:helix-turn-helix domain-containing protein, partial [Lactobacillus helveticus]
ILKRKEGTNVLKGIKLRLYPNRTQQNQLEQMFGNDRFHSRKYLKKSYTGKSIIKTAGKRYLKIPKLGYVKTSKTGVLQNTKIKRYTVLLEPTGKYYLSLQVEI